MTQLPLMGPVFWSVAEITRYLRDLIEEDSLLQDVWVHGEISNLSRPSSGHLYYTLKDKTSALKCVMWRNTVMRQAYNPREGDAVEVHGSLNIYETAGSYQLYTDIIRPVGEGVLYQEFMRLKARLEAEGLFAPERKKPIPAWPTRIGIVTSPTGAALRDMLNTLRRRFPMVEVILAPTAVQGVEAPLGIISALHALNEKNIPDVILLARGGGSIEDLWAFNDERVARAIFASPVPIITGIGHETDFTIADFVCDLRAPTPTAAAELATPNQADIRFDLQNILKRLAQATLAILVSNRIKLDRNMHRLSIHSPVAQLRSFRQHTDECARRGMVAHTNHLRLRRTYLDGIQLRLGALNPHAVLRRGYAIVNTMEGNLISSIKTVKTCDSLQVRFFDGKMNVLVVQKETGEETCVQDLEARN